ncbi:MAG TPA: hypothetical protein VJS11_11105 [Acidobacteriaceae bacterium]|nr:hypothetical protein [Acidobacteriaceae bacterium]
MRKPRSERIAFTCSAALLLVLFVPTGAYAQFGGLFSAILGTITGPIGGALTDINRVRSEVLQTEQQALWPVALIEETRNYIATIRASYRGWMNSVFVIRVNSAILPSSRSLESEFLSAQSGHIPAIGQSYTMEYGAQPAMGAAPQLNLQMMDIEDATAKDATEQSMAADQATQTMLQTAQKIEDQAETAAPGTADMVAAEARTAELASIAMQQKLLAYQLREAAIELSHRDAVLKQSTTNMQNLNQQLLNHIGGGQ